MKNLREEIEKLFTHEIEPDYWVFHKDQMGDLLELFRSWALEMVDLLDEFSRIEITHKDGSKSRAVLEHQIEGWKAVVKEKIEEATNEKST